MIRCPSCGNQNRDGEAFCAFCAAILQAPPTSGGGGSLVPPPRAPAGGAVPPPPAPPRPTAAPAPGPSAASGPVEPELDPLDQFLVKEASRHDGPDEFVVEELGSFASNFDNLEDQLDDAHRAAVLKQKMAALQRPGSDAGGAPTGDKFDQLDALLDAELAKAKQAALQERSGGVPSASARAAGREEASAVKPESDEETLKKLDRYRKYIEEPEAAPSVGGGGSNELIRYLEAKTSQQAIEIERLKQQKAELVREVFSDALNEESKGLEEKLEKSAKEIERLEKKVAEANERRAAVEEKLLVKADQMDKLLQERQRLMADQQNVRGQAEAAVADQLQARQRELDEARAAITRQSQELAAVKEQIARQTKALVEARTTIEKSAAELEDARRQAAAAVAAATKAASSRSGGGADPEEVVRLQAQVTTLQDRVKKTMAAGATQLKSLANYYEVILNHIAEIVIVFDTDERIMLVNRAARNLLHLPPAAPIQGALADFEALAPVIPAAERAMSSEHTLHGGDLVITPPGLEGTSFRLSFCPIVFPTRSAFLLIMEEIRPGGDTAAASRPIPAGTGLADHQLAAMKEQVFSLKILAEILASKPDRPDVVAESAGELRSEISRILELLDHPERLV